MLKACLLGSSLLALAVGGACAQGVPATPATPVPAPRSTPDAATAPASPAGGDTLPAVTVDAPTPRKAVPKKSAAAARSVVRRVAAAPLRRPAPRRQSPSLTNPVAAAAPNPAALPTGAASPTAPVPGYVAVTSATGTKTAAKILETPQAIDVIGAEQIRDREARTVSEAVEYSPGVLGDQFGNDIRNDFILIRGFNAQATGYFLDGLQLISPGFATFKLEPFNLERLEVLKGPASVLYGGASTGGLINGVSKRPLDFFAGYVESGIDNYGNAYNHFDLSGPSKLDPRFSYRVEGVAEGGGTQTDFTPQDRLSIAPSLTFRPDASTAVTVIGSYQKDRTRGLNFEPYFGSVQPAQFGRIPTSLFLSDPSIDTFQRNQALIGYAFDHRFDETFAVRQNLRYSDLRINDRTVFANGYVEPDFNNLNPASATLQRFNFNTTPHLTEFAVDTQGEADFRTGPVKHVLLAGVDYRRFTFNDLEGFALGSSFNLLQPTYGNNALISNTNFIQNFNVQDQVGEYLQEQARFDRFTLVLSGRHDSLFTSLNSVSNPAQSQSNEKDALTGRVGLIYDTPFGLAPYATYATSFSPLIGTVNGNQGLQQPERGELTEVGFKYEPFGPRLLFTGALYNLVQTNVPTVSPANPFFTVQTGAERSRGYELGAQGQIADGFKVLAALTGYQIRTTEDGNPALVGKVPVAVPQAIASLFLDYTFQSTALRGFGLGAGVRYVGGSFASQDNTFGVPSYALADFAVHYEREHWRVALNINNAFDKTYVTTCSSTAACFYGQRARYLTSLAYKW